MGFEINEHLKPSLLSLVTILIFSVLAAGSFEESEHSKELREKSAEIKRELKSKFNLSGSNISARSSEGNFLLDGYIEIQNKSSYSWKNVSLILNQPDDEFSSIVSMIRNGVFRAPADESKVYSIEPGELARISLKDFSHSQTKEKFSTNKYSLISYTVFVEISYKGEMIDFKNTFRPNR